ncbi:aKG-HExxH-type peptide beta-hydroxylase [Photorhabdus africana]|uniref:aKG-HExxH-type peptide beta-hydroxylase n=1 Tax=Photorhabdus africana TaxID=3097554 RepID=UPI002B403A2B|nr:HEXXH motif-containing putative peptide modification protein [Photorhabdus sp. CRI-LC]
MLSILGKQELVKNVYLLSRQFLNGQQVTNTDDLRPFYLKFIQKHQPYQPVNVGEDIIVVDDEKINALKNAYQPGELDDLNQLKMIGGRHSAERYRELSELVRKGYIQLSSSNADIKLIFDLVIHTIFFRQSTNELSASSFGGSSSTAIGSIWISGHGNLTSHDVAEFLLHELTHHLLFIDERCHEQFNYQEIIKPENYSMSALLGKRRPLDKVVHSILVSHEILNARRNYLESDMVTIHPATDVLKRNTINSIAETLAMKNLDNLVTKRTRDFLLKAQNNLN